MRPRLVDRAAPGRWRSDRSRSPIPAAGRSRAMRAIAARRDISRFGRGGGCAIAGDAGDRQRSCPTPCAWSAQPGQHRPRAGYAALSCPFRHRRCRHLSKLGALSAPIHRPLALCRGTMSLRIFTFRCSAAPPSCLSRRSPRAVRAGRRANAPTAPARPSRRLSRDRAARAGRPTTWRRGGDRRHRPAPARLGGRRHPARKYARLARRPGDRRDQHQRAARRACAADRQRPRPRRRAAGPAAERPAHFRLPRASRHSDRSHPAGRDPARGSRAQIWLSRRPEGGEHRPSPALPLDRRRSSAAAPRPTAAMPAATATSPA